MDAWLAFAVVVGVGLIYVGILRYKGVFGGDKPEVEALPKTEELYDDTGTVRPAPKKKKKTKGALEKWQDKTNSRLMQANWGITFNFYILQRVLWVVALTALLTILTKSSLLIWLPISLATVVIASKVRLDSKIRKRRSDYDLTLENLLIFTMHNLQADMPFPTALEQAAERVDEPVRSEIAEVIANHKLGTDLDVCMDQWGETVDSNEVRLFCGAYKVAQQYGGRQLRVVLENIAESVRTKNRKKGQLEAAVAEQRLAAVILALTVPAISFFMISGAPDIKRQLLHTSGGLIVFFIAAALEFVGIMIMYWLINRIKI